MSRPPRSVYQRRTTPFYVGAALVLAAVIALFIAGANAYVSSTWWVEHTLDVQRELDAWLLKVLETQSGGRRYLASEQAVNLDAYETGLQKEQLQLAVVRDLVRDSAEQAKAVDDAARDVHEALDQLGTLVELAKSGQHEEARALLATSKSRELIDKFRGEIDAIRTREDHFLVLRRTEASSRAKSIAFAAILLLIAATASLAFAWRRDVASEEQLQAAATDARTKLDALSALATALSNARTRSEVAAIIVEHGTKFAGADTCTLYELNPQHTALDLVGHRGVAPNMLEKIERIDADSHNPSFDLMKSGESIWVENETQYAELFPKVAQIEGTRVKSFWSVPLTAEGEPIGLLGAGFFDARTFSPTDRALVRTLANHCGQALLRATRLEREEEARNWLTTTLRSIGDAVIATDALGRVDFMNAVAEKLTGWKEQDARGRPLDEVFCIFSEQTRATMESPVTKVLREGAVVGLANHTLLRSKQGIEIPIDDSGAPIHDGAGKIAGVVLVFRDVTVEKRDRMRTEFLAKTGEALVSSLDYEATLATVSRFAVPTLADWCAVTLMEPGATKSRQVAVAHADESKVRFAKELGEKYPADPEATTGVPHVLRTGKSELYSEIPQALLEAGAKDDEHLKIIRGLRLESAMIVPLSVRGKTLGAITFVYADSGRRYTEDDLVFAEDFARRAAMAIENAMILKQAELASEREKILRSEAEVASRAKDEFLATVSHELRTPLNAILGWTVIVRRLQPAAEIDRGLAIVERNARSQAKLIEDVLDVSRVISGKLVLRIAPTSLPEIVRSAIETVTPAAEAKEIKLRADIKNDPLMISVDPDRMQQVVWNLLSNAVKFTPKGGEVSLRASREGSDVVIEVADTGEGIRADVLPLVFEAFHQADASTTRKHGGLGLGLAIVKQLVSAHGGAVRAESEGLGKGATFHVRLPARAVVSSIQPNAVEGLRGSVVGLKETSMVRLNGLSILVVDDDEDALALVSEVLRAQGAEVHEASSVREALEKFPVSRPQLLVSDIGMPQEDGLSLIRKIRALPHDQGGNIPAIALTAYASAEDAKRSVAAGFHLHLTKPVEIGLLVSSVESLRESPSPARTSS